MMSRARARCGDLRARDSFEIGSKRDWGNHARPAQQYTCMARFCVDHATSAVRGLCDLANRIAYAHSMAQRYVGADPLLQTRRRYAQEPDKAQGVWIMNKKLRAVALAAAAAVFLSACNDDGTEARIREPNSSQVVSQVISFGDSLSDVGTYNPTTADADPGNDLPSGLTFSTKPGLMWNQHVAIHFGHTLSPSRQVRFGVVGNGGEIIDLPGTAFAEGGARIEEDAPNGGVVMQTIPNVGTVPVQTATSRAIKTQIDDYLADHGGVIDQRALVLIQGGANDFFGFLSQVAQDNSLAANAPAFVAATATAMVGQIQRLKDAGATRIIYANLPDLGLTPQFRTTGLAGLASQISAAYNEAVGNALASMNVNVFDTAAFMQQVIDSPSTYGFTNVTTPACASFTSPGNPASLSALICFPTTVVAPGADLTYLFADNVHPTAAAHALWGVSVVQQFPSP